MYEDDDVMVLFKPAGMTVQGNQGSTLEQWAAATTGAAGLQFVSDPECWRQREQKGVSGLVLGLKNQTSPQPTDDHVRLQIQRKYSAVVAGPVARGALSCEHLCTCCCLDLNPLCFAQADRLFLSKDAGATDKENAARAKGKKRAGKREQLRAAARAKWTSSATGSEATCEDDAAREEDPGRSDGASCLSALQIGAALEGMQAVEGAVAAAGLDGRGTWVRVLERGESAECVELCIVEIWAGHSGDAVANGDGSAAGGAELPVWPRAEHDTNVHDARQMRRAMLTAGHAVVGQRAIGKCRQLDDCRGTYLSCTSLRFLHPVSGQEMMFCRQLPLKFRSLLDRHSRSEKRQRERERQRDANGEEARGVRSVGFCGLTLETNDQVFVPRAGTAETVVERARQLLSVLWDQRRSDGGKQGQGHAGEEGGGTSDDSPEGRPESGGRCVEGSSAVHKLRVLDLGTGSGCLLLAALHTIATTPHGRESGPLPSAIDGGGSSVLGVGVDNDEAAIQLAARNAENLGMSASTKWVCADFGRLHEAEVRSKLGGAVFDMILLAPPESAEHKWGRPRWEMRGCEPRSTTVAGPTGLEGYEAAMASIAQCDPPILSPGAWLLVRANSRSHHAVRQLLQREREAFEETEVVRDGRGVKCGIILRYKGGKAVGGGVAGEGSEDGKLCGIKVQHFDTFDDALEYLLAEGKRGDGGVVGDGGGGGDVGGVEGATAARGDQDPQVGDPEPEDLQDAARGQARHGSGAGGGGTLLSNAKVIWLLGEMLQRPLTADEKRRARKSGFRVAPEKFSAAPPDVHARRRSAMPYG